LAEAAHQPSAGLKEQMYDPAGTLALVSGVFSRSRGVASDPKLLLLTSRRLGCAMLRSRRSPSAVELRSESLGILLVEHDMDS
jgi:ABC-type branched-subunit amino acid transport system ATPase component